MAEINVTPLVDVMLVLLIIFMVTVTLPAVGVPVELPESRAAPVEEKPDQITISIDRAGVIYIEDAVVPAGGLPAALEALDRGEPQPLVDQLVEVQGRRRVGMRVDRPHARSEASQSSDRHIVLRPKAFGHGHLAERAARRILRPPLPRLKPIAASAHAPRTMATMADNPKGYANPQLLIGCSELHGQLDATDPPLVIDLRPAEAIDDMARILASGANVVSSSVVPLLFPEHVAPDMRRPLEDACLEGGTSCFTSGIDPATSANSRHVSAANGAFTNRK